jgi:hypothetical protein
VLKDRLFAQIETLIERAPDEDSASAVRTIAPLLAKVAAKFGREEYYIRTQQSGEWIVETIASRHAPEYIQRAIYAYPTAADAIGDEAATIVPLLIPVTHLIFELSGLPTVDRLVFFNRPHDTNKGRELTAAGWQRELASFLQRRSRSVAMGKSSSLPNDLC